MGNLEQAAEKRPLIVLTGPTAVGKTALSIQLARRIGGEIISADSMQVYRHMDIGSAKVTKEEMNGVRHHLIDVLDPWDEFNVVVFQRLAKQAMEEIYAAGHIPIIAGGTGFYIQALVNDIDFTENDSDTGYREELECLAAEKGVLPSRYVKGSGPGVRRGDPREQREACNPRPGVLQENRDKDIRT